MTCGWRSFISPRHAAPNVPPTLLVDVREQNPFNFTRFRGWFAGIEKRDLREGTRWFISVPSSVLPLARAQRLQAGPVRQQRVYGCLSYRSNFEAIRSSIAVSVQLRCNSR